MTLFQINLCLFVGTKVKENSNIIGQTNVFIVKVWKYRFSLSNYKPNDAGRAFHAINNWICDIHQSLCQLISWHALWKWSRTNEGQHFLVWCYNLFTCSWYTLIVRQGVFNFIPLTELDNISVYINMTFLWLPIKVWLCRTNSKMFPQVKVAAGWGCG